MPAHQTLLILDFGSQYPQLIARRIRELSVRSEIRRGDLPADAIRAVAPLGVVLSGGPSSIYEDGAITRTSNYTEAMKRDAKLIFIFDPFVPFISKTPGAAHKRGMLYNIDTGNTP